MMVKLDYLKQLLSQEWPQISNFAFDKVDIFLNIILPENNIFYSI